MNPDGSSANLSGHWLKAGIPRDKLKYITMKMPGSFSEDLNNIDLYIKTKEKKSNSRSKTKGGIASAII